MVDIKDSVGLGGMNRWHDVALVQALLVVAPRQKTQAPYLPAYDGLYQDSTRDAIARFQADNNLAAPDPKASVLPTVGGPAPVQGPGPVRGPSAANGGTPITALEKSGFMAPNGSTIKYMTTLLSTTVYKDLRIIEGTKVVYWPGRVGDAVASSKAIRSDAGLEPAFRGSVARLVGEMFTKHGIVLSLARQGGLRTFEAQYHLTINPMRDKHKNLILHNGHPTYASDAGPGESNHNFGMAVDLGFKQFKWLEAHGLDAVTDWWLQGHLKMSGDKRVSLWNARNALAKALRLPLHKTNKPGDLIHLQSFDDAKVNTRHSLAKLLNMVGALKWKVAGQIYSSDLGFGGAYYPLGKSEDVWGLKSNVTATVLAAAQKGAGKTGLADATAVQAVKVKLKADFEAAEAHRFKWVPLP